jgi:hypothetical protein
MMHFQIKCRKWSSIHWLINSRRDIELGASEGKIERGMDFKGREIGVEKEDRM